MGRLLGWLERWTGLSLTRETAEHVAARQISESLTATVREVVRRFEEMKRADGGG